MSVLTLKLIRDLWKQRWQYTAVGVMITLGITLFCASYMMYRNLESSYEYSYDVLNFEHFGVSFHAAPERAIERVRRIPGVNAVEGRLVEDVVIELKERKLIGRFISLPTERRPEVNDLRVISGSYISSSTAREVLLEKTFASHHNLEPGDEIVIERGGGRTRLRIAGIVSSPEYIYVVRSKQDILPMPDTFGVMLISTDVLGSITGMSGMINEVRVRVADPERMRVIVREAERQLSAYEPEAAVLREDQPSHQLLRQDLEGFQVYAILFPLLLLSVSGLTVYTLLMRMVHLQRPIIGLMRALGFGRGSVIRHYVTAGLLIGLIGSGVGVAVGSWLGTVLTRAYVASFIAVPYMYVEPQWSVIASGMIIGIGVCFIAAILPARMAAQVRPAEIMRPVAPVSGRVVALDRLLPPMPLLYRIPLRNLFRQPKRTLSTLFGICASLVLIMIGQGLMDSSSAAMEMLMEDVYRDDLRLEFMGFHDQSAVNRVRSWPGVTWAEGTLELPVEFEKDGETFSALLRGLDPGTRLYGIQDEGGERMTVTHSGVVFGPSIKNRLGLNSGDVVRMTLPSALVPEQPREILVRAAGFNWEMMGTVAYLPVDEVRRLFGRELAIPPGGVTGIRVKADPRYHEEIRERLEGLPNAAVVTSIAEFRAMIDELMEVSRQFIFFMLLFGMALAFSIVFNMVTVNVLERSVEVATMRTLGFSRWHMALMITFESMLIAVMAVAVGLPLGRWLVDVFLIAAQTEEQMELFTYRAQVNPETYVLAAAAIVVVMLLSQWPSIRGINRMDLAKAAKERGG